MIHRRIAILVPVCVLSACSMTPKDEAPTLRSLKDRTVTIEQNTGAVDASVERAKQSYETLLKHTDDERLRRQAMRRLADLEMQQEELPSVDTRDKAPAASGEPDFEKAISLYSNLLRTYPQGKDNDRILYQLARAYEMTGELENALDTLTRLVREYPDTPYFDEAQFRRGELLFVFQDYDLAQQAYATVVQSDPSAMFYERATYKHGWALYKQERYGEALDSFFALLNLKLEGKRLSEGLSTAHYLTDGDKELLSDAFRVVSLAFSYVGGVDEVRDYFQDKPFANYEFLVYEGLGELYLRQERFTDAARAFSAFGDNRPQHPQALLLQARAIEVYQNYGFAQQVLEAKQKLSTLYTEYARYWANNTHYGFNDYLLRANEQTQQRIDNLVATNVEELARHYHAQAQKSKNPLDYDLAIKWYQTFLRTFQGHPKGPELNFLLAEASYEDDRYAEAIREYEKTAYNFQRHEKSSEAAYAALLAYEEYKKQLDGEQKDFWNRLSIQSAQRFTKLFPKDERTPQVLARLIDELYESEQYEQAAVFAQRVLMITPTDDADTRRRATIVLAHNDFEGGNFAAAEKQYEAALKITLPSDEAYQGLADRLAASVYKQGEAFREAGKLEESTRQFLRVAAVAPASAVAVTAQYDAAANLMQVELWRQAIPILEQFRRDHPEHELATDVNDKLMAAYLNAGDQAKAAEQLEKIAANTSDTAEQRQARWQAAEMYEKAKAWDSAIAAYKRYVQSYPTPLEQAVDGRQRIAELYKTTGDADSRRYWLQTIVDNVKPDTQGYSDHTRVLAANAALELAEPSLQAFEQVKLVAPLKENLQRKRQALDAVLKAYGDAASYRVAEVTTAATYQMGRAYGEFSRALLSSERPAGLSAEALEQYEIVLEDQAFPLEEKAIEIHETNAKRVADGIYDEWVSKSIAALASLLPARYAKAEESEPFVRNIQ